MKGKKKKKTKKGIAQGGTQITPALRALRHSLGHIEGLNLACTT